MQYSLTRLVYTGDGLKVPGALFEGIIAILINRHLVIEP